MKNLVLSSIVVLSATLPLTANAQDNPLGRFYVVAEAGLTKMSAKPSGAFTGLTIDDKTGASFGGSIGTRLFTSNNVIFGFEGSFASSGGSSYMEDTSSTLQIDSDYTWGGYFTLGGRFGTEKNIFAYGLLGIGGTSLTEYATFVGATPDATTTESGNGLSIGAAIETQLDGNFGIRIKTLHNMYKKGASGSKINDTSVMAGLVVNF